MGVSVNLLASCVLRMQLAAAQLASYDNASTVPLVTALSSCFVVQTNSVAVKTVSY